jgi:hypothetical protein
LNSLSSTRGAEELRALFKNQIARSVEIAVLVLYSSVSQTLPNLMSNLSIKYSLVVDGGDFASPRWMLGELAKCRAVKGKRRGDSFEFLMPMGVVNGGENAK